MNIQEKISRELRQIQDERDHRDYFFASELGKCLGGAYYRRLKKEPTEMTDQSLRVINRGIVIEDWAVSLITKGLDKERYETQASAIIDEYECHGRIDLNLDGIPREIKSVHEDKLKWLDLKGVDDHYMMQLMFYLMATGAERGELIYITSNSLLIRVYILLAENEKYRALVLDDLRKLKEAWKKQEPPEVEEPIVNGRINWKAKYCSYHHHCMGDDKWLEKAEAKVGKSKSKK